jgi:hypothetical protein
MKRKLPRKYCNSCCVLTYSEIERKLKEKNLQVEKLTQENSKLKEASASTSTLSTALEEEKKQKAQVEKTLKAQNSNLLATYKEVQQAYTKIQDENQSLRTKLK